MASERGDVSFVQHSMYYRSPTPRWTLSRTSSSRRATFSPPRRWPGSGTPTCPRSSGRSKSFASPLRASDEQLAGHPPAFVIEDEADVLRDEGEAYAARLRAAGVAVTTVRYDGITHDFMMLNPLSGTHATRAAVAQAI
jgi:acetyl esterase